MSARNLTIRLRAIGLALVWTLPGVWCTGHALAHELEPGHHELEAAPAECVTRVTGDPHPGHDHPESPPAVAPDGSKKVDPWAPLAVTVQLESSSPSLRDTGHIAVGCNARLALAQSGPRAPPTS